MVDESRFLSTPSARRATLALSLEPCDQLISIHALREEGDLPRFLLLLLFFAFLSTPSARRATDLYRFIADFGVISIHALREEGDK